MTAKSASPQLIVALDVGSTPAALGLMRELGGLPIWVKVGLELFTAEGPGAVRSILGTAEASHGKSAGRNSVSLQQNVISGACPPVFLDLKFHDIPNTVRGAVRSATRLGVSMLTLHLAGGEAMAQAALKGRQEMLKTLQDEGCVMPPPLLMGITQLTSTAGENLAQLQQSVVQYALAAREYGLDGVVCSGLEADLVKKACGPDFLCLCPGIRFPGAAGTDDQARICSPGEAVRRGADFLVIGRPITQAENMVKATHYALELMGNTQNDSFTE